MQFFTPVEVPSSVLVHDFQQLQEGVFLRSTMLVWKHVATRTLQLWPESYQYGQLEVLNYPHLHHV